MKAAETAGSQPMSDPALAEAKVEELGSRDDAVLASHETPDLSRVLVTCARYSGPK
jgi:hypothetical protein